MLGMTQSQSLTVQRITRQAAQAVANLHMCPMVFRIEKDPDLHRLMLVGTNAHEELRWFERALFMLAWIGPKGGAEFRNSDIVPRKTGGLTVRVRPTR